MCSAHAWVGWRILPPTRRSMDYACGLVSFLFSVLSCGWRGELLASVLSLLRGTWKGMACAWGRVCSRMALWVLGTVPRQGRVLAENLLTLEKIWRARYGTPVERESMFRNVGCGAWQEVGRGASRDPLGGSHTKIRCRTPCRPAVASRGGAQPSLGTCHSV